MKLVTSISKVQFVCLFIIDIHIELEMNHSNTTNYLRPFDGMVSGNPSGAIGLCSVIRYLILGFDGMVSGNPSSAIGLCLVIRYLILLLPDGFSRDLLHSCRLHTREMRGI